MTIAARGAGGALVVATLLALGLVGSPASAQDSGWVIESFDVLIEARDDATLHVTETIDVDFGGLQRHGIYRVIPVRYDVAAGSADLPEDTAADEVWRAIDISDIEVESSAPDDLELTRPGPTGGTDLTIRIGDPDVTVSGRHRYRITYVVAGAYDQTDDGLALLNWDATGDGWGVPILSARVAIDGPTVVDAACWVGSFGSAEPCAGLVVEGDDLVTTAEPLAPGEGLTVLATFPLARDVPPPLYVERWSLGNALAGSPFAWPLAALVLAAGFAGVTALVFREGRDRVTLGGARSDGTVAPAPPVATRRALFAPRSIAVEFRPPEGLRPAQLGVLLDESVDRSDISATVVDLAVRGHLTIEEVETKRLFFRSSDWRLRATGAPRDELLDYERELLDGLFEDGDEVLVSDLKGSFHTTYREVQRLVYADATDRGWFGDRPDKVRTRWLAGGIALTIAAAIGTVVLTLFTEVAVVGIAGVAVAATLSLLHRWMPHRTPTGSVLLRRALGFREFVHTAETDRMAVAEEQQLFVRYLPYAVGFGAVERWAQRFAALGQPPPDTSSFYVGHGPFDVGRFSDGMSRFSQDVGTSLATMPSSSSGGSSGGGFSGGGFGGGGGGSW